MSEAKSERERPASVAKVQGWVDQLTEHQEIHCDWYPQADNSDPISPSWALLDIDRRQILDFIDQNAPGPDDHHEISTLLGSEEAAGRIVGVARGFYRHPSRAAADRAASEQRQRFYDARSATLDPIFDQLGKLAEELHQIDPSQSVEMHMRNLGDHIRSTMHAWGEDELPSSADVVDEDDVPF